MTSVSADPAFAPRNEHVQRHAYSALRRPEMFMAPLLKTMIEEGIRAHCRADPAASALDVGCGRQPFRALLQERVGTYVSLDAQAADSVVPDYICAIDRPLVPALIATGPFAFILCTEVMEHVADWPAAFSNLARLLAPGGRLLLTAPHFYILHEEPYDFYRPTIHAFEFFAQRHDLRVVEIRRAGDCWDMLGTMFGSCRFDPVGKGWGDWLLAKTLWRVRNAAFRAIHNGWIRRHVRFGGPTYLSNYVVLERLG